MHEPRNEAIIHVVISGECP